MRGGAATCQASDTPPGGARGMTRLLGKRSTDPIGGRNELRRFKLLFSKQAGGAPKKNPERSSPPLKIQRAKVEIHSTCPASDTSPGGARGKTRLLGKRLTPRPSPYRETSTGYTYRVPCICTLLGHPCVCTLSRYPCRVEGWGVVRLPTLPPGGGVGRHGCSERGQTLDWKLETLNPTPSTLNPEP